jgi:sigma-B regulation protein RsbU (phosphoserine phosphatase)
VPDKNLPETSGTNMSESVLDILLNLLQAMAVPILIAYVLSHQKIYERLLNAETTIPDRLYIAVVFGGFSIYGTLSGISVLGAVANVRDLGPAIAGLLAGPVAGIGAGLIGAVHRYSLGGVTALPCAVSTIFAGLAAGWVYVARKGRFPSIFGAVLLLFLLEWLHMAITLAISPDFLLALSIVRRVALPMVLINSLGIGVFAYMYHNVMRENRRERSRLLMASELRIARDIQMSMVPGRSPKFPEHPEIELHAVLKPARDIGGDLYDYFMVDGNRLFVVIGDVSGKGVPAALFMAVTMTLLSAEAGRDRSPDEVLSRVNTELCRRNDSGMFVTVFMGVLDLRDGRFSYCSGGHNPPFRVTVGGDVLALEGPHGLVLGVIPESGYGLGSLVLGAGDSLLLYTDGVTEAMDPQGDFFGEERLTAHLARCGGATPEELCGDLLAEVDRFASGAAQSDDITLVALRYCGAPANACFEIGNDLSELAVLSRSIEEFGSGCGMSGAEVFELNLALEELIVNAISYGYDDDLSHQIRVRMSRNGDLLSVTLEDDGRKFNPLEVPIPDIGAPLEERQTGGLGVHLARNMMDSMDYARDQGTNRLRMTKRLGRTGEDIPSD